MDRLDITAAKAAFHAVNLRSLDLFGLLFPPWRNQTDGSIYLIDEDYTYSYISELLAILLTTTDLQIWIAIQDQGSNTGISLCRRILIPSAQRAPKVCRTRHQEHGTRVGDSVSRGRVH
jgi:hypothetical protein